MNPKLKLSDMYEDQRKIAAKRMIKYAELHGFRAYEADCQICVEIPYAYEPEGFETFKAKNIKELREVLGY